MQEQPPRPPLGFRRFNARRATRQLLLVSSSVVGALSAYWLTPRVAATSQTSSFGQQPTTDQEAALLGNNAARQSAWDRSEGWGEHRGRAHQARQEPGFSWQPQQAPQGWSRGS